MQHFCCNPTETNFRFFYEKSKSLELKAPNIEFSITGGNYALHDNEEKDALSWELGDMDASGLIFNTRETTGANIEKEGKKQRSFGKHRGEHRGRKFCIQDRGGRRRNFSCRLTAKQKQKHRAEFLGDGYICGKALGT